MRLTFLSLTLAALVGGTLSTTSAEGADKDFQSWQVLCRQTLACTMRQFRSGEGISQFELQRTGGPNAPVSLVVYPGGSSLQDASGEYGATLSIDGGPPTVIPAADIVSEPGGWAVRLSGDFVSNGFIGTLKNGTALKVNITQGEASSEGEIALAGAAASLLFIDEQQKRIGHTDALVSVGDKAPNPAPPAHDITRFTDFPERLRARFAEGGECAETEESMLDGNAIAHKLSDEQTLYVTPCGLGGAYNMAYAVFLDSYGAVSTLGFPTMLKGAPSAAASAFNLGYDYEAKTFSAFFKGRGIGDCGTISEWKLEEGFTGPQLVLIQEEYRDCPDQEDATSSMEPADWPKTWPLK
ncbi:MAG: DUF1176 domain-containing protein [Rhizobium sp.]|nr:DUF1176 domain-containing protein [Rhizobium sp.]